MTGCIHPGTDNVILSLLCADLMIPRLNEHKRQSDFTRYILLNSRQRPSSHGSQVKMYLREAAPSDEGRVYFTAGGGCRLLYSFGLLTRPRKEQNKCANGNAEIQEALCGLRIPCKGTRKNKNTIFGLNSQATFPSVPRCSLNKATFKQQPDCVCNSLFSGFNEGTYSYTRTMSRQIQDIWRYIMII